jgi:hypothetical protein
VPAFGESIRHAIPPALLASMTIRWLQRRRIDL